MKQTDSGGKGLGAGWAALLCVPHQPPIGHLRLREWGSKFFRGALRSHLLEPRVHKREEEDNQELERRN